jgi:hypothetical protein
MAQQDYQRASDILRWLEARKALSRYNQKALESLQVILQK